MNAEFLWTVPADHPAFAGHFPGRPIVPGVVILDQAIRYAETMRDGEGASGQSWQVGTAKFFSPVVPEEALTFALTAKLNGSIAFSVHAAEREIAAGSLTPIPSS